jgi:hypothetical protein
MPLYDQDEIERAMLREISASGQGVLALPDLVNHPPHYTAGAVECIDAIEAALGRDGFVAYCQGQVVKYLWRLGRKGPKLEDARKAQWYAARLVATLEG